jgi:hemoglobin
MDEINLEGPERDALYHRLILTAQHMINSPEQTDEKGFSH